jgi:selenocysteine lyase/cysteine desulfurase
MSGHKLYTPTGIGALWYSITALKALVPSCDIWGDIDREGSYLELFSFTIYQSSCVTFAADLTKLGVVLRTATHCAIPLVTQTESI